jgi:hypothetical protein
MLKLDRSPLEDQRQIWLTSIQALVLLLLGDAKADARQLLIWAMQPNAPYSALTRSYLATNVPRLADPASPHPWVEVEEPRRKIAALIAAHKDALAEVM